MAAVMLEPPQQTAKRLKRCVKMIHAAVDVRGTYVSPCGRGHMTVPKKVAISKVLFSRSKAEWTEVGSDLVEQRKWLQVAKEIPVTTFVKLRMHRQV